MKKTQQIIAVSTLLPLMLTGCGGGGSSSDNPTSSLFGSSGQPQNTANAGPTLKGQILGLQGLRYETESESGYTSETGQFNYRQGDTITFYVGDIALGSAPAAADLDIGDLAGGNPDTQANIERFLLTLDYDLSPANGVLISTGIHNAAKDLSLNFKSDADTFNAEAEALVGKTLASDEHMIVFHHSTQKLLPKAYQQASNRAAQQTLASFTYPTVSAQQINAFPGIEEEANAVFDLMLSNTVRRNDSPLEFIFSALNTPLILDRDAEGSLFDLYVEYKERVAGIGKDAPHISREEFAPAFDSDNLVEAQHFVVMSDFQMRDDESPLNVNPVKFLIPSSYYPASAHISYQVDDMVRTLREYETDANKPVEMAIFTGDFIDISQYNEVRLGIDVLDGGMIDPDTGLDDDPIPGTFSDGKPNDTYDPFMALGLNGQGEQADIPWYYVTGNHDGLMLGNFPITDEPLNLFGQEIRGGTREFYDKIATGNQNWFGYDPSLLGFLLHFLDGTWKVEPDADRRVVNQAEIAEEMFNSTSQPHGHGMQHVIEQQGSLNGKQHYSFSSNSGLIKHIALDTNMPLGPEGWMTLQSLSWLRAELEDAETNGQLVIISSHHKPKDIIINGPLLVDMLNEYPNVIAHLVAHSHINAIRPRAGEDALHSYWEIESGSMVNWPQQFRMLDIKIDPASATGVITSTMLNHSTDSPLHVSNRGRFLSFIERYLEGSFFGDGGLETAEGAPEDRNTHLYFKVPDSVLARLQ